MCVSEGDLRARLDGELTESQARAIEAHLAGCERCRRRAESVAARATAVSGLLADLPAAPAVDPARAYMRFQARARSLERDRAPRRWMPALATACALVLATLCVTSGPTRAFAQKLLGFLRVKNVVVIPMNRDLIAEGKGKLLGDLLSGSVAVTKEEKPMKVSSRQQAAQLAGFTVRLPALRSDAPQLEVQGAHAMNFTVNPDRLQTLLGLLGRPDLQIPDGLANAKIAIDIQRGVTAVYGNCPQRGMDPEHFDGDYSGCVIMAQSPTPTAVTLPELDLSAVAELGLQLSGMSVVEAHEFSRTIDWASALVIPLPRDAGTHQNVMVDGVPGVLISGAARGHTPARYALVWIKDGFVYTIIGFGDSSAALPLAESLG